MNIREQSGFTYIEVLIAIMILMVGILAMAAGISGGVIMSRGQEQQLQAKQLAASAMEAIMSAKETDPTRLGWNAVGNVGTNIDPITGTPKGVFVTGVQDILSDAGPDGVSGTADDTGAVIPNFRREIIIQDICDTDRPSANCPTPGPNPVMIRSVSVNITYYVGSLPRTENVTTILTSYLAN